MPRTRAAEGAAAVVPAPADTGEGAAESSAPILTKRQLEILRNVARGRTNRQIGEILGISEKTVRNHLRTISHKLSTSDRTHAVVIAIGNGWIAVPIEPDSEPVPIARVVPQAVATD